MAARLDAGGIVDELTLDDGQVVSVRFDRCLAGWQASFELSHPEADDLAVVHRLVASSLPAAKAAIPAAVSYLCGTPLDVPLYD